MADSADADELMKTAWNARRRFLSATGIERDELIREAHRLLVDAVAVCRKLGEQPRLAQAIHLLANVEHDMGRAAVARQLWEEAVSICRKVGDDMQLAHKVRHLGDLHRDLGSPRQAESCYREALALYRGHADAPDLDFANALARMAALKEDGKSTATALGLWREARERYAAAGVASGVEECSKRIDRLSR